MIDNPDMQPPSAKPGVIRLLFFFFWFLFLIVFRSQPFNDPGALWHIRVGDVIFANGFPHADPFTWSYAGKFWIPQQWGAECLMSILHRIGGFDALLVSMGALMAGMATWLAKRFTDGGLHWMPAIAFVSLGMAVAGFHFYLRPHLATIVLMAVVMAWIVDVDRGRANPRCFFWLIPLSVLWTNLHGGVLGGIFIFGLAIGGWILMKGARNVGRVEALRGPPEPQTESTAGLAKPRPALQVESRHAVINIKKTFAVYIAIFIASLLATLINPFGYDMHRTWWSIVGSDVLKEHVSEHMPLSLKSSDGLAVAAFGAFYIVMLVGVRLKEVRVPWLIPLVWLALSWTSIRHGPLFVAVALVAMADFFPKTIWYRLLVRYGDTFARPPAESVTSIGWKGWSVPIAALLLSFGLQAAKLPIPFIGYGWARFDHRMIPDDNMVETLQAYAKTRPDGFPIFNDANLGGFLIYYTPSLKVFWDDRCELYRDAGLRDYIDLALAHPERIEEWAEKTPFDRALVDCDTEMDKYLRQSPRWREVVRCEKAVLYERVK